MHLDGWKGLLVAADPRPQLVGVKQPYSSAMSVLEVALDPTTAEQDHEYVRCV